MTTRLKCLLLDDELPGLTYLKMLCEQLPELEVVKAYNDAELFLQDASILDFDLCIIDIEMPKMNGLQVARVLQNKPVIFTTAYKEYAAEAFDLDAVDYVRKPIIKERLQQAVQKAHSRLATGQDKPKFIQLNTDKGKALIYFDQLCYIKASDIDSRDKLAQMNDGSEVLLKNVSFEKLFTLLPEDRFVRINKKEVISLKAVQVFSHNEITINISNTASPIKLFLSEAYRADFLRKVKF